MVMYLLHIVVVQDPIIFLFYCLIYKIEKKKRRKQCDGSGKKIYCGGCFKNIFCGIFVLKITR